MVLIADPRGYEASNSGGGGDSLLYNLKIAADMESPRKRDFKHGKKLLDGWYEDVWFLSKFNHIGVVSIHHKHDSKERVLCNKTFGDARKCPACDSYQNAPDRKTHWIKSRDQVLLVPVLAVRRQHTPHIHKGRFQITPIYWFEMKITNYREDYAANYLRLREANEKHPIHKHPYRIFAKKRGEREIQEYYFKAIAESEKTEISVEHPLIDDWLDERGRWLWDNDYKEMLSALAVARYKQYVNPSTSEVFDYEGIYSQALEQYETYAEQFPSVKTELETPITAREDEEELD
jgi:hypothetical protein